MLRILVFCWLFSTIGAWNIESKKIQSFARGSTVAHAGWFDSAEQSQVNEISEFQKPISTLSDQLHPSLQPNPIGLYTKVQLLRGGKEDSTVVYNYLVHYIQPLQELMTKASSGIHLKDAEAQKQLETLPLLMKGHILELQQAIQSEKAEEQTREVEEIQETLGDFLKVVSSEYQVTPYIPNRQLSDKELFGPLSCEFWGMKRAEGSNTCIELNN
eukprot:scaffold549_cov174-Ochromonas_danica.AAC.3